MNNNTIWVCVYRDTIEQHDCDENLTDVLVTKEFFEQYFNEVNSKYWDNFEDFLGDYNADDVQDFYEYAMKYNAVLDKENW